MFTEHLQYGRYCARYYKQRQTRHSLPPERHTEYNAGRPLRKERTTEQMTKALQTDHIHRGQEFRERDLLVGE